MLTEKDLIRQVASNLTKAQMVSQPKLDQAELKKGKQLMQSNLAQCKRIWHTFEKFVNKQVCQKGKAIDT